VKHVTMETISIQMPVVTLVQRLLSVQIVLVAECSGSSVARLHVRLLAATLVAVHMSAVPVFQTLLSAQRNVEMELSNTQKSVMTSTQ